MPHDPFGAVAVLRKYEPLGFSQEIRTLSQKLLTIIERPTFLRVILVVGLIGSLITVFSFVSGITNLGQLINEAPSYWLTKSLMFLASWIGQTAVGMLLALLKMIIIIFVALLPPGLVVILGAWIWVLWEKWQLSGCADIENSKEFRNKLNRHGMAWLVFSVGIAMMVSIAFSVFMAFYLHVNPTLLKLFS